MSATQAAQSSFDPDRECLRNALNGEDRTQLFSDRTLQAFLSVRTKDPARASVFLEDLPHNTVREFLRRVRERQQAKPDQAPTGIAVAVGYTFADAMTGELTCSYFIKHVLGPDQIAVFFGESGSMKSFVGLDGLLHVAAGREWCGRRVRQTGVLIVLGEGQAGYRKRLRAWALHRGIDPAKMPVYVLPHAIDLYGGPYELREAFTEAERVLQSPVRAALIDTYSTNLGSGDEQQNRDTSIALRNTREGCGPSRGAAFIHHVGHGDKQRERGAYQLRANADQRFLVARDDNNRGDVLTISNEKQKDDPELPPLRFEWKSFSLGTDEDGDSITSLVVDPTDREPADATGKDDKPPLRGVETRALDALWSLSGPNGGLVKSGEWLQLLTVTKLIVGKTDEACERTFRRMAKNLHAHGLVNRTGSGKKTAYSPRSTSVAPDGFSA